MYLLSIYIYIYLKDNETSSGLYSFNPKMSHYPSNNINPGSPLFSSIYIVISR